MLTRKIWHSCQLLVCCGFLLLAAGCGLSEMFGGGGAEKITEPCIELISSPTPAPILTFTPQPGNTPTPSEPCRNAPGIVLICDEEPIDVPIIVITPPPVITEPPVITPPPIMLNYTISVSTLNSLGCTSGTPTILPPGPVIVASGATQTFVISPPLGCPISIYFNGTFLDSTSTGPISVTTPPVIINSNLLVYY